MRDKPKIDLVNERCIKFNEEKITEINDLIPYPISKYIDSKLLKIIHRDTLSPEPLYITDFEEDRVELISILEEWIETYPQFEECLNRGTFPEFLKYGKFLEDEEVLTEFEGKKNFKSISIILYSLKISRI